MTEGSTLYAAYSMHDPFLFAGYIMPCSVIIRGTTCVT